MGSSRYGGRKQKKTAAGNAGVFIAMYQPKRWRAERGARRAFLGIMMDGPKGRAAGCFFAYSRPRPNCQEGTPPAGRAPPCTRWGESLPPDPGATSRRRSVPKRCAFSAWIASGPPCRRGVVPLWRAWGREAGDGEEGGCCGEVAGGDWGAADRGHVPERRRGVLPSERPLLFACSRPARPPPARTGSRRLRGGPGGIMPPGQGVKGGGSPLAAGGIPFTHRGGSASPDQPRLPPFSDAPRSRCGAALFGNR